MAGFLADGIGLALVLGHAGMNVLDDVRTDWGREDLWQDLGGTSALAVGADNGNGRSGGHFIDLWSGL